MNDFLNVFWNEFARGVTQSLVALLPVIAVWIRKKLIKKPIKLLPWLIGGLVVSAGVVAIWTYMAKPGIQVFGFADKTEVFYKTSVSSGWEPNYDKNAHLTQFSYNPEVNEDLVVLWEDQKDQGDVKSLVLKRLRGGALVEDTEVVETKKISKEDCETILKIPGIGREKTVRCITRERPLGCVFLIVLYPSGSEEKPASKKVFDRIFNNLDFQKL